MPKPKPAAVAQDRVAIDSLIPDPHNARERTPRNLDTIKAALKRFGQQKPIVVDADSVIRAGNGTWLAARDLGWSEIWIHRTTLTGDEARAYAIADNRASDLSQFDEQALIETLSELGAELAGVAGFDAAELDELLPSPMIDTEPRAPNGREAMRAAIDSRITVRVLLSMHSVAKLERALKLTGFPNREQAMQEIVSAYLESKGQLDV